MPERWWLASLGRWAWLLGVCLGSVVLVGGTVWWGVLCHVQAQRHLSGATRSVELAAIGRRACEQEWDALAMLERI